MAKSETRAGKTAAATRTSKLQKERDILAAIVDTAAALIVVLNPRGQIVHFNRACEEATGYSAEEMKNRHIWDMLIPAEQVNEVKAVFAKLISGDFPSQHENYWVAKDGARRLIAWTNTAIHDERGKIEYVIATGIDVTENRLAETELQYRTHQLGERVKELRCLYGVSRLREQRYLSLEEMLEGVVEIIPPAWQYPEITCARITLQGRAYCSKNFKKTQWMQSAEIVAEDENVGVVEVYYLEKRPEAAEGPFLEEERSLVDAIAERLSRIVERTWDEQRIMDYQRQLRHLASELSLIEERERRRLASVLHDRIGQSLAMARIKLAGLREQGESADLDDVLQMLEQTISDTRSLTFELSPPVLHELGFEAAVEWLTHKMQEDHQLNTEFINDKHPKPLSEDMRVVLFQAVRELLHNVTKHAHANSVMIKARREEGSAVVEVIDDGVGFDPAKLASGEGGDGFGLFSIRERLQYLHGTFAVESQPGAGTRVILTAPLELKRREDTPARLVPAADDADARIKILLVDDQKITREGLRALLEKHGDMEVVAEAAGGKEAIELASHLLPDVVVMDVAMPDVNGIEATRRILDMLPDTKIVALSMYSEGQYVLEMLRAGASGYLLKDCAQEDLAHAIRAVNAQLTFFSPGIADSVVENYVRIQTARQPASAQGLTPREREVLKLLAAGLNTKEIAHEIDVSIKTVEAHRQHIMDKLETHSVAELTKYAIREGLAELDT